MKTLPHMRRDIKTLQHQLLCPECHKTLRVIYDDKHDETYCIHCGVVLRCPPGDGFCPEVEKTHNVTPTLEEKKKRESL